jgi:DNA-binding transcriptional ArsR family regulator
MTRELIEKELRKGKDGYTVSELAEKLEMSRNTVANALAFLEGARKVTVRKVGNAKLYYWK